MTYLPTPQPAAHTDLAHSEEYFGAYRDYWWNADFLALMARRWSLADCRSLLDVGCGQCHWSRALLPHLPAGMAVTGLDRDPKWAAGEPGLFRYFAAYGATLTLAQGEATALPYADASFDVVTCQTVLIHLPDPLAALREMRRVVRPGGWVICAEPSNLANAAAFTAAEFDLSPAERLDAFRYRLLCEAGKRLAGEGDSSLGDQLAWLFSRAGFDQIHSHLSDKAGPLLPGTSDPESQANRMELHDWLTPERNALWDSQVARWLPYLGVEDADFVRRYTDERPERHARLAALLATDGYWDGGASLTYLVSAQR
ncbi:class I SAM-dependent methyltransferase [Chitinimonas sp.]|uniref:class I SAM-dependent methyltransferase n=1 Tax=Chitinimonas sp. TaxID=1934313 RepID=UPI002F9256F1